MRLNIIYGLHFVPSNFYDSNLVHIESMEYDVFSVGKPQSQVHSYNKNLTIYTF